MVAVALAALLATASPDGSGQASGPETVEVSDLRVGDCFDDPGEAPEDSALDVFFLEPTADSWH